ncbi:MULTISPECIES: sugar ABC transporter permease [Actinomadura]|nr:MULTISPECIES: sugar ABC transporter permease [Actinomadura]
MTSVAPRAPSGGRVRGSARRAGPGGRGHAAPRARRRRRLRVLAFLSPWLIGFGMFFAYPLAATVYFSFTRYNLFTLEYVGFDNYKFLLRDDDAWTAMRNTLWLVAIVVPLRVVFGLGVAQLLTRVKRGGALLRSVFYLPYLIPPVSATVAFVYVLNPGTGPFPVIADRLGVSLPDFFNDSAWAKPGLGLLGLWAVGDVMIILLAALLNVPASLYEAAAIDGAGAWARFRHITLPTVSPVLAFSAVTGVIQTLQYFTQALVAAKVASGQADLAGTSFAPGYPGGSTLTFPQWLYDEGFRQFNMGYACVLALVMFVVAMAFTLVLLRQFNAFAGEEAG